MILCRNTLLESWMPNFSSSAQPNPSWIRVKCADVEISNALGWVDWTENPVQLLLCDACGHVGCQAGGYAHVGRVADSVLLTAPQLDDPDEWERSQYEASYAIRKFGAMLVQGEEWTRWRSNADQIPEISGLLPANGRSIADAWRMSVHNANRAKELDDVAPLLTERLLGSDTMDPVEAIQTVKSVIALLRALGQQFVSGRFVDPAMVGASVETLYFDGPREQDWVAFAFLGDQVVPAFGKEIIFIPSMVDVHEPASAA